jgi:glucose-1-phosphate thymidylyltransferase
MFLYTWADVLVEPTTYQSVVLAAENADAVIAVNEVDDPTLGAAVTFDEEGIVASIVEKPPPGTWDTRWNNSGVGVLGPEAWLIIDKLEPSARGELELTDALATIIERGAKVRAVPVNGHWFEIGTPEQLEAARAAFPTE